MRISSWIIIFLLWACAGALTPASAKPNCGALIAASSDEDKLECLLLSVARDTSKDPFHEVAGNWVVEDGVRFRRLKPEFELGHPRCRMIGGQNELKCEYKYDDQQSTLLQNLINKVLEALATDFGLENEPVDGDAYTTAYSVRRARDGHPLLSVSLIDQLPRTFLMVKAH
jgi:hypothetical protein